jgi:hypothetical protein
MDLTVRLTSPDALYGVVSVLHARRVALEYLVLDDCTLKIGVGVPRPQLGAQLARRSDVVFVDDTGPEGSQT